MLTVQALARGHSSQQSKISACALFLASGTEECIEGRKPGGRVRHHSGQEMEPGPSCNPESAIDLLCGL